MGSSLLVFVEKQRNGMEEAAEAVGWTRFSVVTVHCSVVGRPVTGGGPVCFCFLFCLFFTCLMKLAAARRARLFFLCLRLFRNTLVTMCDIAL